MEQRQLDFPGGFSDANLDTRLQSQAMQIHCTLFLTIDR
jgi:hypothetical protein